MTAPTTETERRWDVISGWLMALWFVIILFMLFGLPALLVALYEAVVG